MANIAEDVKAIIVEKLGVDAIFKSKFIGVVWVAITIFKTSFRICLAIIRATDILLP